MTLLGGERAVLPPIVISVDELTVGLKYLDFSTTATTTAASN
jgi:hypothetical protein